MLSHHLFYMQVVSCAHTKRGRTYIIKYFQGKPVSSPFMAVPLWATRPRQRCVKDDTVSDIQRIQSGFFSSPHPWPELIYFKIQPSFFWPDSPATTNLALFFFGGLSCWLIEQLTQSRPSLYFFPIFHWVGNNNTECIEQAHSRLEVSAAVWYLAHQWYIHKVLWDWGTLCIS